MRHEGGWIGKLLLWPLALVGLITLGIVALAATTYEGGGPERRATALVAGSANAELTDAQQATFDRSCKICHGIQGTGAPRTGDAAAWQPLLDQGMATLLEHTISGHRGMPPMGMCMDCGQAEFVAFIEYMGQFDSGLECDS